MRSLVFFFFFFALIPKFLYILQLGLIIGKLAICVWSGVFNFRLVVSSLECNFVLKFGVLIGIFFLIGKIFGEVVQLRRVGFQSFKLSSTEWGMMKPILKPILLSLIVVGHHNLLFIAKASSKFLYWIVHFRNSHMKSHPTSCCLNPQKEFWWTYIMYYLHEDTWNCSKEILISFLSHCTRYYRFKSLTRAVIVTSSLGFSELFM